MDYGGPLVKGYNQTYLKILFRDALGRCMERENVDCPPMVTKHISGVLYDSVRSCEFFVMDSDGRMIDNPAIVSGMADKARDSGDRVGEYSLRVRTGDLSLLLLGMFHGSRTVKKLGRSLVRECGRRNYGMAQRLENYFWGRPSQKFEAMADLFVPSVNAIRRMIHGGELRNVSLDLDSWIGYAESAPGSWTA